MGDNTSIDQWVEDNYDPFEETPGDFIEKTDFRGVRKSVAMKAAMDIRDEESERPAPPFFIPDPVRGPTIEPEEPDRVIFEREKPSLIGRVFKALGRIFGR